jgi:hypothetical protein
MTGPLGYRHDGVKHLGIWLAMLAAAFLVVLPASAAMPALALASAAEPACHDDSGPSDATDRLASEATADTEEEENEKDGGDDDDVAHAHPHAAETALTSEATQPCGSGPADVEPPLGSREHAPRGPPAAR